MSPSQCHSALHSDVLRVASVGGPRGGVGPDAAAGERGRHEWNNASAVFPKSVGERVG